MITEQESPIDTPPEHCITADMEELEIINRKLATLAVNKFRQSMSEVFYLWGKMLADPLPAWYTFGDTVYLKAYLAYTNYLNWHRPRGRKLSWRKLNRVQRAEALTWYARQVEIGGVARWRWIR